MTLNDLKNLSIDTLENFELMRDKNRYQNVEDKDCAKCDCHLCVKCAICAPCGTCNKAINMCQWFEKS